jgi:O-antigen ligase
MSKAARELKPQRTTINRLQAGAIFITLAAFPSLSDFTGIPKYLGLLGLAIALFPLTLVGYSQLFQRSQRFILITLSLFVLAVGLSVAFSDFKYKSLFGEYGRNNGAFTYFALIGILLSATQIKSKKEIHGVLATLSIVGQVNSFIGILQFYGFDFIGYAISNGIAVGTMGNPNFFSALLGFTNIVLIYFLFIYKSIQLRILLSVFIIQNLLVILISDSSQGIFVSLIGCGLIFGFGAIKSKKIRVYYFTFGGLIGSLSVLGIFQFGPLTRYVYQNSTTYRGDYFRAGIAMIRDNPLTGVGLDRFGDFYRQYRDLIAVTRTGSNTTTDYAHNIFIQFGATGGLLLLAAFALFQVSIGLAGYKKIKDSSPETFLLNIALLSLWISYLVVSMISIDQVAVALWGWIFAGLLIGDSTFVRRRISEGRKVITSMGLLVLAAVFMSFAIPRWNADREIKIATTLKSDVQSKEYISALQVAAARSVKLAPNEVIYWISAGDVFYRTGDNTTAEEYFRKATQLNPQSYQGLATLANFYKALQNIGKEVEIREAMLKLDNRDSENFNLLKSIYIEKEDDVSIARITKNFAKE